MFLNLHHRYVIVRSLTSVFAHSPAEGHADTQIFFYLYIGCLVVSSCYTLVWDLKMDWGLFDRNAGENTFLREEIVYPQKVFLPQGGASHHWKKVAHIQVKYHAMMCFSCFSVSARRPTTTVQ